MRRKHTRKSKTRRNKIRKNPKKIVKQTEKLKNLNNSGPFQQTSISKQQHSHTHAQTEGKKNTRILFCSRRILGSKAQSRTTTKSKTIRIDSEERSEERWQRKKKGRWQMCVSLTRGKRFGGG